ncbi:hypothetical protein ES705_01608 [subsurface metagenome]|nr:extracellular solute-binding protein [Clostridia bacterium]
MKKSLFWLLIMILTVSMVVTFSLAGCKKEAAEEEVVEEAAEEEVAEEVSPEEEVAEEAVTLEVWHMWHGGSEPVFEELVEMFMEDNPNVTIKTDVVPFEEFSKVVKMALTTGTGPDVLHGDPSAFGMQLFAQEGFLYPLSEIAEKYNWNERFPKSHIEYYNRPFLPEIYGISLDGEVTGVFYNKEIFNELGLVPPTTWVEFENVINTVFEAGYQPFALGNLDQWPAISIHGSLLHGIVPMEVLHEMAEFTGKYAWTDEGFIETARLMQEWGVNGYFGEGFNGISYDDSFSQLYTNQAAMMIMGNWALATLDPNMPFDYGFFPMPSVDPNIPLAAVGSPSNSYSIVKTAEEEGKLEAAGKFIDFMLSDFVAGKFYEIGRIVALDIDTTGLKSLRGQDEVLNALSQINKGAGMGYFPNNWWAESWETYLPLMQVLLAGEITPEDFCQQVQESYGMYVE